MVTLIICLVWTEKLNIQLNIPYRSDWKVSHVKMIMWMCHMPPCDEACMPEIESKFKTNMAIIERKWCQ